MNLSNLRRVHVLIIGSVVCIIAVVGMYYGVIKPRLDFRAGLQTQYDAAIVDGNTATLAQVQKEYQDTLASVALTKQEFNIQMRKRMPNLSFGRRDIGMLALWDEQINKLGPTLESFARDKSVKVTPPSFAIQAPPSNPNDSIFDQSQLVFPLGSITVQGDFKSVMKNVTRWNNCSRLVMVGPVTLTGNTPNLQASYSLTCYVFPLSKGGSMIELAPAAGSSQMAAGMGGAPGMMGAPGGMPPSAMGGPGMPPGGMSGRPGAMPGGAAGAPGRPPMPGGN